MPARTRIATRWFKYEWVLITIALPILTACVQPPDSKPLSTIIVGNIPATLLGGNQRVLTGRSRPLSGAPESSEIFCSAPSPDWATAYATAAQLTGSGSVPSGPSITASGSYSVAETITQLAGRTAGVVALRDGIYAACQAYANGVIGQDAYSLILSQYGTLLFKLVSASGSSSGESTGAAATTTPAAPSSTLVSVTSAGTPPAATPKSTAPATPTDSSSDLIAEARAQMMSAFLVACITENDPTRLHALARNQLLTDNCPTLVRSLAAVGPSLLQYPPTTATTKIGSGTSAPVAHLQVAAYQAILQSGGFYKGKIDGQPGPETKAALNDYQRANNLPETGKADKATLDAMKL